MFDMLKAAKAAKQDICKLTTAQSGKKNKTNWTVSPLLLGLETGTALESSGNVCRLMS